MKSIKKSVWTRIAIILLAIIASGGITIFGLVNINSANNNSELASTLHSTALESEKAHYLFLESVQSAVSIGTEYQPKDYKSCGLGLFLYSDTSIYSEVYPELDAMVSEIMPLHQEIHEYANQLLALKDTDKQQAFEIYANKVKPDVALLVQKLDTIVSDSQEIVAADSKKLDSIIRISIIATIICTIITLFASFMLVSYIIPKVVNPLMEITRSSRKLADGELDFEINVGDIKNEVGVLAEELNESVAQLKTYVTEIRHSMDKMVDGDLTPRESIPFKGEFRVIQDAILSFESTINTAFLRIRQTSETVAEAARMVSEGSQTVASGSVQQSASVQELAGTLQNITEQIRANTQNAGEARVMTQKVGDSIVSSNAKMGEMTVAMDEIGRHSEQISNIIKTIEDIAFQTNILALNAAVEAARAGASGKGFAVVADEVSNLATKSSEAAKNTTKLIADSIHSVKNGTKIARETAELLGVSVTHARDVSNIVEQISDESDRQSSAVLELLEGINQISSIVHSNSATAEESAATSEELNGQAVVLQQMISKYKLNDERGQMY